MRCGQCKWYFITWEHNFPNGCKAWGIKTRLSPSALVKSSSGLDCQLYQPKDPGMRRESETTEGWSITI